MTFPHCSACLLAWIIAAVPLAASAQEQPQAAAFDNNLVVTANRVHQDGLSYYALQATGVVRASPQQTWKVLTTYGDMQTFVPNLASAKLISRNGAESIIEQKWVKHILFFTHTVNLVVRATETPLARIDIALVSGEMKHYSARWEIAPNGNNGTRITYSGKIEPESYMPAFFGTSVMLSDLNTMMYAVLEEIDKAPARNP